MNQMRSSVGDCCIIRKGLPYHRELPWLFVSDRSKHSSVKFFQGSQGMSQFSSSSLIEMKTLSSFYSKLQLVTQLSEKSNKVSLLISFCLTPMTVYGVRWDIFRCIVTFIFCMLRDGAFRRWKLLWTSRFWTNFVCRFTKLRKTRNKQYD